MTADFCRCHVNQRRGGGDGDRFGECADLHRQIECLGLSNLHEDASPVEPPEAFQLRRHPVAPGDDLRNEVAPVRGGEDFAKDPGVFVGHDDGDAREDGTRCVGDFPADVRCALLGE